MTQIEKRIRIETEKIAFSSEEKTTDRLRAMQLILDDEREKEE